MVKLGLAVLCVVFLIPAPGAWRHADAAAGVIAGNQLGRLNTWSARSSTGTVFSGTWTVAVDPASGAATGIWTLNDQNRATIARGGWSAVKSPTGWNGSWRAAASGGNPEYAGTWSASLDLKADAPFADLFARALQAIVGGTWRAGQQSGSWSIRAFN